MDSATDTRRLHENLPGQRREWRVERVGWALMAATLLASAVGLFGGGPVSRADARAEGVGLRYERFLRRQSPDAYRFSIDGTHVRDGAVRVRFDDALLDALELDRIEPEPDRVEAGPGRVDYVFAASAGERPIGVVFFFRPARIGRVAGQVTVDGARPMAVDQFVYP